MAPHNNNPADLSGRRFLNNRESIPHYRHKYNAPDNFFISQHEKYILCRLMLSGKPEKHDPPFADRRHKIIYDHLTHLQDQVYQPSPDLFVQYLREFHLIEQCGGEGYVRAIFRGIPQGVST
jgi:hypothetical protein